MQRPRSTRWQSLEPFIRNITIGVCAALALAGNAFAQAGGASPWENAVNVLQTAFTGPIAKGLALVAIVVGGLTFAFGEGGGKRRAVRTLAKRERQRRRCDGNCGAAFRSTEGCISDSCVWVFA